MRFITDTTPKSKGYYYENVKDGVEIIACDNPEGTGVPDTLDGKKVVAIGDLTFANEQIITSANMSSNIQSIGKNAFLIGNDAFRNCFGLEEINISDGEVQQKVMH